MLEFFDYSSRRGALVTLLPKIHQLLKQNANNYKLAGNEPPAHFVTWSQKIKANLLDVKWRFLVAKSSGVLAGFLFYRHENNCIYIEDLQVAWTFRNDPGVVEGLFKKLEFDAAARDAEFFASERIRAEADKEILASVGFKETHEGGWEKLGKMTSAIGLLKLRYNR